MGFMRSQLSWVPWAELSWQSGHWYSCGELYDNNDSFLPVKISTLGSLVQEVKMLASNMQQFNIIQPQIYHNSTCMLPNYSVAETEISGTSTLAMRLNASATAGTHRIVELFTRHHWVLAISLLRDCNWPFHLFRRQCWHLIIPFKDTNAWPRGQSGWFRMAHHLGISKGFKLKIHQGTATSMKALLCPYWGKSPNGTSFLVWQS